MLILSSLTTHHWHIQLILDALGILFSHSIVYGFENPTLYPPRHKKHEISTISKYSQYGYQSSSFFEYNSTVIFLRPNSQAWDRMDPFEQSLSGSDLDFPRKCENRPDIDSLHYRFDTDNLSIQMRIFLDVKFQMKGPWSIYDITLRVSERTRRNHNDRFTLLLYSHYFQGW